MSVILQECSNCGDRDWDAYGVAVEAHTLHPVQCRCRRCGLVFANPQADDLELASFYNTYYVSEFPQYLPPESEADALVSAARWDVREFAARAAKGKFLEIGFGSGRLLAAARAEGFDVWGVELAEEAVAYARRVFQLENVWCSTLEDRVFPSDFFDVVYAWHVIEHVRDLSGFITEIRRVLKPGGLLFVGTESADHTAASLFRLASVIRGRIPRTVTANEHTYVFSRRSLRDALERRGFTVSELVAYDEVRNRLDLPADIPPMKRAGYVAVWTLAAVLDRLRGTGPYLKCYAYKDGRQGAGTSGESISSGR